MLLSRLIQSSLIDPCVDLFIVPYGTVSSLVNIPRRLFFYFKASNEIPMEDQNRGLGKTTRRAVNRIARGRYKSINLYTSI